MDILAKLNPAQKQAVEDTVATQNLMTSADTQPQQQVALDLKGPVGGPSGQNAVAKAVTQVLSNVGETQPQGDGAVLSVTTQAGDVIHYKDSKIDSIEKKDGTILNVRLAVPATAFWPRASAVSLGRTNSVSSLNPPFLHLPPTLFPLVLTILHDQNLNLSSAR